MSTANQRASRKQEARITKTFKQIQDDARTTISSGAIWIQKSDVVTKLFRIEAKTKVKKSTSMSIKKEWLDKIQLEAFESSKTGLLAFSFGDGKDYLVIDSQDFISLMEELIDLRKKVGQNEGQD